MKFFNDLRVSAQLSVVFGILVMLSVLTGGFAIVKLDAVERNLEDIVQDNNVKIRLNNELSESVHIVARVIRTITILHDAAAMKAEEAKVVKARANYDKAWDALRQMPADESGKRQQETIAQALAAARPFNSQVLQLALAGQDQEAMTVLLGKAGPATQLLQDTIDEYIRYQEAKSLAKYEAAKDEYARARGMLMGSAALTIMLAIGLGILTYRAVTRPLLQASRAAKLMAEGDLTFSVESEGDNEFRVLMQDFEHMRDNWVAIVANVRSNAESVASAGGQIAQGNDDLSTRTEQQAAALQQTASSMEQLGSTVTLNADNARQASQLANGASTVAANGGEVVEQVVKKMKGIDQSAKRIAEIISVIDGIAFQTNILALNAAVEAARAGDQGRGFAVVASEVRNLAKRSADAAREIKSLINESVETVDQGVAMADQAGATMNEIVHSIRRVTDIMAEISSASAEQKSGVLEVGKAVSSMDQGTQQNAALVEQTAAASVSLRDQATQLVEAVSRIKLPA